MRRKFIPLAAAVSVLLVLVAPLLAFAEPAAQGTGTPPAQGTAAPPSPGTGPELLTIPGLDGPMWFKSQCCGPDGMPYNEVQVAEGWKGWWLQLPPKYIVLPENCQYKKVDNGCFWARPEFVDSARTGAKNRIHGGNNSQKYFTYGRMHEAGLWQRVNGLSAGLVLHFSIYMSTWMCIDIVACKGGYVSDHPTTMHMRVGIDPAGGTDPTNPNIVWSPEVDSFDRWTQYSVEAVSQGTSVTVFTHSRPEWTSPRQNNDVYVDDASLTIVGTPVPTAPPDTGSGPAAPAAPQPANPPAQAPVFITKPQTNQRPDGSLVHIVQQDDTLFGMALAYGVTVDDIMQLNHLEPGDYLQIGQEIIVKGPARTATAAPPPQPTPADVAQAKVPAAPGAPAASVPGGLCVRAFDDRNADGLYDNGEDLVSSVKFSVVSGSNTVAAYTSAGENEPHCFAGLAPGAYVVRIEPPVGYAATDLQAGVSLASGQTATLSFATHPVDTKSAGSGSPVAILIGLGVLVGAGVLGYNLFSRKR